MHNLEEIFIPLIIFSSFYFIIKLFLDHRMRTRLIEKGEINANLKYLFAFQTGKAKIYSNLKWGFVLVGIGVAMLCKQIFGYSITDESVFGLMFLFAGIGFLAYYWLTKDQFTNGDQNGQA